MTKQNKKFEVLISCLKYINTKHHALSKYEVKEISYTNFFDELGISKAIVREAYAIYYVAQNEGHISRTKSGVSRSDYNALIDVYDEIYFQLAAARLMISDEREGTRKDTRNIKELASLITREADRINMEIKEM